MPLDTSVKVLPEARLYLSSSAQTLVSIGVDSVTQADTAIWQEVGFLRGPVNWAEPIELTDVYKRFDINHTKKGRQQRKQGSFAAAFQNAGDLGLRHFWNKEVLMKIEWHVEDAGAVDEYEHFKSVRFLNFTRDNPETGETVQRVDFIFSVYGSKTGP